MHPLCRHVKITKPFVCVEHVEHFFYLFSKSYDTPSIYFNFILKVLSTLFFQFKVLCVERKMAMTEKNHVSETGVNNYRQNGSISHLATESDMLKSQANGHTKNGLNGHAKVSHNNHHKN